VDQTFRDRACYGRVALVGPTCGVYLFNLVKVGGGDDPLRVWNISVVRNGKVVRQLSLRKVRELATDQQGYYLLQVSK
jgi:hypothetical protein